MKVEGRASEEEVHHAKQSSLPNHAVGDEIRLAELVEFGQQRAERPEVLLQRRERRLGDPRRPPVKVPPSRRNVRRDALPDLGYSERLSIEIRLVLERCRRLHFRRQVPPRRIGIEPRAQLALPPQLKVGVGARHSQDGGKRRLESARTLPPVGDGTIEEEARPERPAPDLGLERVRARARDRAFVVVLETEAKELSHSNCRADLHPASVLDAFGALVQAEEEVALAANEGDLRVGGDGGGGSGGLGGLVRRVGEDLSGKGGVVFGGGGGRGWV